LEIFEINPCAAVVGLSEVQVLQVTECASKPVVQLPFPSLLKTFASAPTQMDATVVKFILLGSIPNSTFLEMEEPLLEDNIKELDHLEKVIAQTSPLSTVITTDHKEMTHILQRDLKDVHNKALQCVQVIVILTPHLHTTNLIAISMVSMDQLTATPMKAPFKKLFKIKALSRLLLQSTWILRPTLAEFTNM